MKIDLHMHTTASDGTDEPEALVALAASEKFDVIAVTDHDTMAGVGTAVEAGKRKGVRVIPGIELSAGGDSEVHLLGYGIRQSQALEEKMQVMQKQRYERMQQMIEKLNRLGVDVTCDQVLEKADGAISRAHLARVLVEMGYVRDVKEAFARYLSPGGPGFVPRRKMTVGNAARLIRQHGGVPVLAHPGLMQMDSFYLPERAKAWMDDGLMGIEAYHPRHTPNQCARFVRIARTLKLIVTGGSDYHGAAKQINPGAGLERWVNMERDFMDLFQKIDLP